MSFKIENFIESQKQHSSQREKEIERDGERDYVTRTSECMYLNIVLFIIYK